MVVNVKKEVNKTKKSTKKLKKIKQENKNFKIKNNKINLFLKTNENILKLKSFFKNNYSIFLITIPFFLFDLVTRILGEKIQFFSVLSLVPNLFTIIWLFLLIGVCFFLEEKKGKVLYIVLFIICFAVFITNNIYYSMTDSFFDFSLLLLASEGSSYIMDAILNCNILVYISSLFIIITFIIALKYFPHRKTTNLKNIIHIFFIFLIGHLIIPLFLGMPDKELTWSTWRNPRNIYINFNDNNKSMRIAGLYEYTVRNFYITFIKTKKNNNEAEIALLEEIYNINEENYSTKYTGKFKDNNLILLQLEGLDSWLLNEKDTPNLYNMMQNSINFTNHYSYYNGGGSTFNSEFAVNTGFITPLSYTQNAYSFNKNDFTYSLANLFKNAGYEVNAFHMNTKEYYSRGTNYKNWGYDNYYGLKDLNTYTDDSYTLDRELLLNETFQEKMFPEGKFVDYIITYSSHLPFSTEKGVCKKLVEEDIKKELGVEELPSGTIIPEMSEEECVRRQVKETDYMVELLLKTLEEKDLIDNTTIIVFTDHYLYTLSDQSIIESYKKTNNNLINHTPFFIWNNGKDIKKVSSVTSQLNILPTTLNLFGIEYHPNYYIAKDALGPNYQGYVFFSDYSWYDGNVYVDGGVVTNDKKIDPVTLEDKNYYINYIIRKNDLTLKYNYFKTIKKNNDKTI